MKPSAKTIDAYLKQIHPRQRSLLEALRRQIHVLVPSVEECISYGMPAFRWQGKVIAGFAATKMGASYYPFSGSTLATLAEQLKGRSQTKSALHFDETTPLSKALVAQLLKARMAEVGAPLKASRRPTSPSSAPRKQTVRRGRASSE